MCVNTDDVQDDLDEDLKEIQKVKSSSFSIQLTFLLCTLYSRYTHSITLDSKLLVCSVYFPIDKV